MTVESSLHNISGVVMYWGYRGLEIYLDRQFGCALKICSAAGADAEA